MGHKAQSKSLLLDAASDKAASDAATSAAYEFMQSQGEWYDMGGCSVLLPMERTPRSIIHFVGGFVAGSAVSVTYGRMLTALANSGHLIIATPIPAVDLNHGKVADGVTTAFSNCYNTNIRPLLGTAFKDIPIFGLSHSLGGKLTVLMHSKKENRKVLPPRAGNIFLAFNNYGIEENIALGRETAAKSSPEIQKILDAVDRPEVQKLIEQAKDNKMVGDMFSSFFKTPSSARESEPRGRDSGERKKVNENPYTAENAGDELSRMLSSLGDQFGIDIGEKVNEFTKEIPNQLEFTPDSEETWRILLQGYNVQSNIMFKFIDDQIDQSNELSLKLKQRGCDIKIKSLPGNHVTPNVLVAGTGGDTASTPFLRDLVMLLNDVSDKAWIEVERRRNENFMLPKTVST